MMTPYSYRSAVQACCGFIIGQPIDHKGGPLWSDRRLPLLSKWWKAQQNFVVVDAKNYKEGDQLEDESNGFTHSHAAEEMKYTAIMTCRGRDGMVPW